MRLTKAKAIAECQELWNEIKLSGLVKQEFLETEEGEKWKKKAYESDCPLCQYARWHGGGSCRCCPLMIQYGKACYGLGYDDFGRCPKRWFKAVAGLKV